MQSKYRKVYGNSAPMTKVRRVTKDVGVERSVEQKMTKEQLEHLHKCIRFTKMLMPGESNERMDLPK